MLSENLRLLYVAITRAKNKLYLTSANKTKSRYGKFQNQEVSVIFRELLGIEVVNGK